jgi:hypothetical protein
LKHDSAGFWQLAGFYLWKKTGLSAGAYAIRPYGFSFRLKCAVIPSEARNPLEGATRNAEQILL